MFQARDFYDDIFDKLLGANKYHQTSDFACAVEHHWRPVNQIIVANGFEQLYSGINA